MIETGEILQTMQMIQEQNFDIRTITLGINLLDCSHPVAEACAQRVYDKICRTAKDLVRTGEAIERELHTLTPREEQVIKLRYGLIDGRARTLEEVGQEFEITRERIRQIEAKALRKLRNHSHAKNLRGFID